MSRCLGSKQVHDARLSLGASNEYAVAEVSGIQLHLDPGFKQRLSIDTYGRILKEMECFPVPEQGVPVYTYHMVSDILCAFIKALQSVLGGGDDTNEYALHYVDDLVVLFKTFEKHLGHLDLVFRKLTASGFTMNLSKCNFLQTRNQIFITHNFQKFDLTGSSED
jgi:hypothetical protein